MTDLRSQLENAYDAQGRARSTDDPAEKLGHLGDALCHYAALAAVGETSKDRRRHRGNVRMLLDSIDRIESIHPECRQ